VVVPVLAAKMMRRAVVRTTPISRVRVRADLKHLESSVMTARLAVAAIQYEHTTLAPQPVIANQVLGKDRLAEWAFRLLDISPGPAQAKQNLYVELHPLLAAAWTALWQRKCSFRTSSQPCI
jgi:hypothetical protein